MNCRRARSKPKITTRQLTPVSASRPGVQRQRTACALPATGAPRVPSFPDGGVSTCWGTLTLKPRGGRGNCPNKRRSKRCVLAPTKSTITAPICTAQSVPQAEPSIATSVAASDAVVDLIAVVPRRIGPRDDCLDSRPEPARRNDLTGSSRAAPVIAGSRSVPRRPSAGRFDS
jgi:hypothetical protein